jgi:hypothetical protein
LDTSDVVCGWFCAAWAVAVVPLRIMPFGDSITVFDCRSNAYTSADDRPIFNPLNETVGSSLYPTGTFFLVGAGGYRGFLGTRLKDPALSTLQGTAAAGMGTVADRSRMAWSSTADPFTSTIRPAFSDTVAWSYVGSQFLCGAHEGYAGETVEWLANRTTAIVAAAQPDIVLFMAGTNDLFWPPPRGTRDPAALVVRLRVLLDRAFAAAPTTTCVSSTYDEPAS